jgi:predicted RNA binding protein YcfA (HicA-like mRNA interferase family)
MNIIVHPAVKLLKNNFKSSNQKGNSHVKFKNKTKLSVVVPACSPGTLEAETGSLRPA